MIVSEEWPTEQFERPIQPPTHPFLEFDQYRYPAYTAVGYSGGRKGVISNGEEISIGSILISPKGNMSNLWII
jgi:hypothetical protein